MTRISYAPFDDFPGWTGAAPMLRDVIERERSKSLLEVGSGANPTLAPQELDALGVERYTTNDISASELEKAPRGYETLVADVAQPGWTPEEPYDLIFSRMVNEHIRDGRTYYSNLFRALRPGGVTVHCFSTLFALPFVLNRVLPESLAGKLLDVMAPRDRDHHDKFHAYYSWSRGPSDRSVRRLESAGFVVERYTGYFGHDYYRKIPPLRWLERQKSRFLVQHPVPQLTSYAVIVLRRPRG